MTSRTGCWLVEIDIVVFLTGVGTNALFNVLKSRGLVDPVRTALQGCLVVARGPKPVAALSQLKVRIDLKAPEPNTWEQIIEAFEGADATLRGKTVAVQEYGQPNPQFYLWLQEQGASVLPVPVYVWSLPEDVSDLERAIQSACRGEFDVLLWTSAQQVDHAVQIADRLGLRQEWTAAANRCVIGSIGPTCSQRLRSFGLWPDLEPSHPKMAHLVRETLERAADLLHTKQQSD